MGFNHLDRAREFPATRNLAYFNHAAVAPLCARASDAMKALSDDACTWGSFHYDKWMATYDGFRVAAAALIGAQPSEIAITKNTSEGIATIQMGMAWKPGDKVVAFKEEFTANYFPWLRLEQKGVHVEWLSIYDPLEKIDQAAKGARLLAISFVNYLSGFRVDLQAIGDICKRHGCFYFVDAIQGLGVFPIDVRRMHIDALAADGHKWLLGPEGCALLFVAQDVQDQIEPVEFGWTNIAGYNDYSCRDMALRNDAGRYEPGTLNTIGCYGLRASMELLLEIGVEAIGKSVMEIAGHVAAGVESRGYRLMVDRTPQTGSGIMSFQKDGTDSRLVVRQLKDARVTSSPRQGWVRVSPHFYTSAEDVDRLLSALP
ncbi:MAG TPA: aminotransferase class V-fold PLP-dependent enzyme [Bryobacteraceae bacterium]|jgi:selenocysteine lyase/cysteine desulfurase